MKQVLIALDQLANTLLAGHADETLSARAWRKRHRQPWKALRPVIDGVFFWEQNHCYQAYLAEQARQHMPEVYRSSSIEHGAD